LALEPVWNVILATTWDVHGSKVPAQQSPFAHIPLPKRNSLAYVGLHVLAAAWSNRVHHGVHHLICQTSTTLSVTSHYSSSGWSPSENF